MIRYCNRCGCPREHSVNPCPECGGLEFDCQPNVTYEGWLRRQEEAKRRRIDETETPQALFE